ncbi:MAG TPA: hypothetical protein PKW92_08915 [Smithella sp.]|nr:hypothetical protein [Smithellaceae bacterium]HPX31188.1 hypothetical protein [Smithella sp.]HQP25693.1 hypothetical protein [Smithellaceae bacterium]
MTILNAETLPKAGPNIEFAALPARFEIDEEDWPDEATYRDYIFFKWPDDLCGTICVLTHTFLFFDQYQFHQFYNPQQIYGFVYDLLNMASRIAACPVTYFDSETMLYRESTIEPECRTGANLKADILETLLFVAGKMVDAARNGKCLAIIGI